MSSRKPALVGGLVAVASILSGCGIQAKPLAGTAHLGRAAGNHAYVNDPRAPYGRCLRASGLAVTRFESGPGRLRALQIGTGPTGPTVIFEPTPGIAEGDQMEGKVAAAEVIGSALVYPNRASDAEMATVEGCLSINVKG